jgi:histidinol-phosphate aminotransferase
MQSELTAALEAVKNSFNSYTLNTISQAVATASALDKDYFIECTSNIIENRAYTVSELDKLGFTTLPSTANFVFSKHKSYSGNEIFEYLKSKNIYVRHFNKPRIGDYLRITIGTREEMEAMIDALRQYINP